MINIRRVMTERHVKTIGEAKKILHDEANMMQAGEKK